MTFFKTTRIKKPAAQSPMIELTGAQLTQVSGGKSAAPMKATIKFDGIDGESSHVEHKGETEILS